MCTGLKTHLTPNILCFHSIELSEMQLLMSVYAIGHTTLANFDLISTRFQLQSLHVAIQT